MCLFRNSKLGKKIKKKKNLTAFAGGDLSIDRHHNGPLIKRKFLNDHVIAVWLLHMVPSFRGA